MILNLILHRNSSDERDLYWNIPAINFPIEARWEEIAHRGTFFKATTRHHSPVRSLWQSINSLTIQLKNSYRTIVIRNCNELSIWRHCQSIDSAIGSYRKERRSHVSEFPYFHWFVIAATQHFVVFGKYGRCHWINVTLKDRNCRNIGSGVKSK